MTTQKRSTAHPHHYRRFGWPQGRAALDRMGSEMQGIFGDFIPAFFEGPELGLMAAFDTYETNEAVEVEIDVPGVKKKDIELSIANDVLSVSGQRARKSETSDKSYRDVKRAFGAFAATIRLPCEVDEDKIEARLKEGVLKVTLPKSEDSKRHTRTISIRGA